MSGTSSCRASPGTTSGAATPCSPRPTRYEAETGSASTGRPGRCRASPTRRSPTSREQYDLLVLDHPHLGRDRPDRGTAPARRTARPRLHRRPGRELGRARATRATSGRAPVGARNRRRRTRQRLPARPARAPRRRACPRRGTTCSWLERGRARVRDVDLASEQGGRHACHAAHVARQLGHRSVPGRGTARASLRCAREARSARASDRGRTVRGVRLEPDPPPGAHGRARRRGLLPDPLWLLELQPSRLPPQPRPVSRRSRRRGSGRAEA